MSSAATESLPARSRLPLPAGGLCAAVVGLQWGDEGKGKVVDLLAPDYEAVVRYNGGANAGHSVVVKGERYALHLIPSGILYPGKLAIIGNGVVVDPEVVLKETDGLAARGVDTSGLVISDRAHVVMPYHKAEDELREMVLSGRGAAPISAEAGAAGNSIGTTKRGIGPCYADKAQRATAVRMGDLLRPALLRQKLELACAIKNPMLRGLGGDTAPQFNAEELTAWALDLGRRLAPSIRDTTYLLHDMLRAGKRVLFEGANAALLDVDHGTFPFVTSSSCTALGIPAGTGVPGTQVGECIGVVKAYSTRVGNGPMPTELLDETGETIRRRGREYGTTTGRPRRVGWLDLVAVRYSAMLSGATSLAVTLLDVLAGLPTLRVCTRYQVAGAEAATDLTEVDRFFPDAEMLAGVRPVYTELPGFPEDISRVQRRADLPAAARAYLDLVESTVGIPIRLIGVGPDREQTIVCD
jgi:adenylosuccinate synthase